MNENETLKQELMDRVEAREFKKNNGIIMRTINLIFKTKWFKASELVAAVSGYGMQEGEVFDSLDYLEGKKFIQARDIASGRVVEVLDADSETTEVKLTSEGRLVTLGIVRDPGIDM